jgi:transcriptional regulator with XRE-family HTH domain
MVTKSDRHAIDVFVGQRVREARKAQGMSQTALSQALELTFQQVQKYERGTNRVAASTLFSIAQILGRPVAWFFEGLEDEPLESRAPDTVAFNRQVRDAAQMVPEIARIPTFDCATRRSIGAIIGAIGAAAH